MAGYTGSVYREILREHGCPYCYTEMISAKGLFLGGDDSAEILEHGPDDRPLAVQLFGHDPDDMARAAEKVQDPAYGFDCIDLNMGCSARKITSQGSGGALLKDLKKARDVVRAVKSVARLPVTAKARLGWEDARDAEDVACALAEAGLDMLVLHGRTVSQGFSGRADWGAICRAAAKVAIPVVGNGDISSVAGALAELADGPVAGVMVGRAILGNPVFFDDLREVNMGHDVPPYTAEHRMRLAAEHFKRSIERHGEVKGVLDMRKQLAFYLRGIRGAPRLRERIMKERSPAKVLWILEEGWREQR
jgi:nifR3 family TIM-barrel protein